MHVIPIMQKDSETVTDDEVSALKIAIGMTSRRLNCLQDAHRRLTGRTYHGLGAIEPIEKACMLEAACQLEIRNTDRCHPAHCGMWLGL